MGTVNGVGIAVGQVWRTRCGDIGHVRSTTGGKMFPIIVDIDGVPQSYVTTGHWYGTQEPHARDLVELISGPAPGFGPLDVGATESCCGKDCVGCGSPMVPNRESVVLAEGDPLPVPEIDSDTPSTPSHCGPTEPGKHGTGAFTVRAESLPMSVEMLAAEADEVLGVPAQQPDVYSVDPRFAEAHFGNDLTASAVRQFDTGATRSSDAGRYDPEGFLSPIAIERFSQYMAKHQRQPDGSVRTSDNWQKGIPLSAYMKGGWRHFLHLWTRHRGYPVQDPMAAANVEEDLCALLFNVHGMLHEVVKARLEGSAS